MGASLRQLLLSLAKVKVPVLVVIGKKDIQVSWKTTMLTGQSTEQKGNVMYVYQENANHVLKHEAIRLQQFTAQEVTMAYNAPDSVLDEEATDVIYG